MILRISTYINLHQDIYIYKFSLCNAFDENYWNYHKNNVSVTTLIWPKRTVKKNVYTNRYAISKYFNVQLLNYYIYFL